MKKLFFIIFVLLFAVSAWADTVVLRPVGDRAWTEWTVYPSGDRWDAFDDTTANEDVNYIQSTTETELEGWYHSDFSGGDDIDSVTLTVRAKTVATAGTPQIVFGRAFYSGSWQWCSETDTFNLSTSYLDSSITWSTNPCNGSWTQSELNSTSKAWAFSNLTVGTVVDSFGKPSASTEFALTFNYICGYRYQADYTGEVDSLTIQYYDATVIGNVKMGIYSDSGTAPDTGYPYQRLDTTAVHVVTDGCNRIALVTGGVSVTTGTYYWIFLRVSETGNKTRRDTGPYAECGYYKQYADDLIWPATAPTDMTDEQIHYPLQGIGKAFAENRITQSFITVFYTPAVGDNYSGKFPRGIARGIMR